MRKSFDISGKTRYSDAEIEQALDNFYGIRLDDEQKKFRDCIWSDDYDMIFVNARAGTGKTTVAVGMGALLVQFGRYENLIYIASPTNEQIQGFIPGSLQEKSEPYMEPLYEALVKIGFPPSQVVKSESNIQALKNGTAFVQGFTHTYLRGTNIDHSVVILDECQNYFFDSLKKTLTRCHDNSKVIVIGHTGQCDLLKHPERSGFDIYLKALKRDIESGKVTRATICELYNNHRGWMSTWADSIEI